MQSDIFDLHLALVRIYIASVVKVSSGVVGNVQLKLNKYNYAKVTSQFELLKAASDLKTSQPVRYG